MKNDDYTYTHLGASGNGHSASSPVPIPKMRPIGGISSVLIFLLAMMGIFSLCKVYSFAIFYLFLELGFEMGGEEFWYLYNNYIKETFSFSLGIVLIAEIVLAIALFIIWDYRTAKNAVAMTKGELDLRPGFYTASFWVPIVNIFYPYKRFKHIYNLAVKPENRDWSRTSGIIIIWWILLVVRQIFFFYESASPELLELLEYPHKFQFALAEGFWSCLFDVISTLISIRIIWIVNKGQSRIIESGDKQ